MVRMLRRGRRLLIDIAAPDIASNLKNNLVKSSPLTDLCCIFQAPRKLQTRKESLFRPSLVSIGPYHHNSPQLQPMEDIKMWYLNLLLERSPPDNNFLELLVKAVGRRVDSCRKCYPEKQKLNDKKFVEMLVVDGCFIIEYFRKHKNIVPKREDDPIVAMSWMRKTLLVDFLLLENQVPWFVLESLYEKTQVTVESQWKNLSLAQLSHESMYSYAFRKEPIPNLDISKLKPIRHLLDLHRSIILYSNQSSGTQKRFVYTPCIKVLLKAGVSFQVQEGDDLMDIRFENGVLKIPQLRLMDYDEILLGNLVAYEQCDRGLEDKITSYARFLDNLIESSSDIETLHDAGIVSSELSPEDVSGFFIGLYNNVHVAHYTYRDVADDIRAYCKKTIPKWRVMLWRDYFSNPWSGISVIAASIILVLSFVQTWCAVANS